MKPDIHFWPVVRKCWPLFGGAWGAWLVVRRLLEMRWNPDSFGSAAYLMFGLFFAVIFFVVGAAIAALLGRVVESLMRRLGARVAAAVVVATLANVVVIWQIGDVLVTTSAGLRAPVDVKPKPGSTSGAAPLADQGSYRSGCLGPRPTDAIGAAAWDSECR